MVEADGDDIDFLADPVKRTPEHGARENVLFVLPMNR
jgi:hypothetical protein